MDCRYPKNTEAIFILEGLYSLDLISILPLDEGYLVLAHPSSLMDALQLSRVTHYRSNRFAEEPRWE